MKVRRWIVVLKCTLIAEQLTKSIESIEQIDSDRLIIGSPKLNTSSKPIQKKNTKAKLNLQGWISITTRFKN